MPKAKVNIEETGEPRYAVSDDPQEEPRDFESFVRKFNLGKSAYYRIEYEIRDDVKKKMTYPEWQKLWDKIKDT